MAETKQTNAKITSLNELTLPPRNLFNDAWSHLTRNKGAEVSMDIIALYFIVVIIVLAFTFLGNGLRDAFDLRLHGAQ